MCGDAVSANRPDDVTHACLQLRAALCLAGVGWALPGPSQHPLRHACCPPPPPRLLWRWGGRCLSTYVRQAMDMHMTRPAHVGRAT